METTRNFYQVSLRTVLEIVAVIAVVLAFVFQRQQPNGRYQISTYAAMNANGPIQGCYVVDTKTGQLWHHDGSRRPPARIAPLP